FSGATLGARFTIWLEQMGVPDRAADVFGVGLVVVGVTYLSLIIGELVPKQIALRNAEGIASRVARPMLLLARVMLPIVWLLDRSGRLVLRLLGQAGETRKSVTEEEIKS